MQTRTNDNQPGGRDLKGHSSVQPWSQGDIFPCVIARREQYSREGTLVACWFALSAPGLNLADQLWYPSYDAAAAMARSLNQLRARTA